MGDALEFRIDYRIDEAEWARTKRLRRELESEPIFEAFYGDVSISANGQNLFQVSSMTEPDWYNMSVADLAVSLAQMLAEGFPYSPSSSRYLFRQGDDALEVYFQLVGNNIIVSCNRPGAGEIAVDARIFSEGVYDFLKRFVAEIKVKVPNVFEWKDLRILSDIDRVISDHQQLAVRR